jgi:hypothetical protein
MTRFSRGLATPSEEIKRLGEFLSTLSYSISQLIVHPGFLLL